MSIKAYHDWDLSFTWHLDFSINNLPQENYKMKLSTVQSYIIMMSRQLDEQQSSSDIFEMIDEFKSKMFVDLTGWLI